MNKENKLGMGLGALLSSSDHKNEIGNGIQKINISQILPNPSQPRKKFKDEELKELSYSIKNQGLIQPIIVKPTTDKQFQIIAGERRWRACQLNGMHEVDCVIKDLDDTNILEAALIENIQREDLNVIEEANAYKGLINIKNINRDDLSKLIGKSSSHVSNILRLLELDQKIQEMVINGDLSMGHARALIGVPDAINKAKEIIQKKLSVRQVEKITSKFKKNKEKKILKDPNIVDLEK
ncbi:ParB/RepB/Spo0J family partition protein, partial [Pelagibacteraceae bacterium]|nr:ParB/RepB/Spo0J family partition protein [Pelagibacteraceae bacterium]